MTPSKYFYIIIILFFCPFLSFADGDWVDDCFDLTPGNCLESSGGDLLCPVAIYSTADGANTAMLAYAASHDDAWPGTSWDLHIGWWPISGASLYYGSISAWGNDGGQMIQHMFLYIKQQGCTSPPPPPDSDGDGLHDDCDPYPDDPADFVYYVFGGKTDPEGDAYCMFLKVFRDGVESFVTVGTDDPNDPYITISNDNTLRDRDYYAATFCDGGNEDISQINYDDSVVIDISNTAVYDDLPAGVNSNDTNIVETDYLSNVVDNTQMIVDGQTVINNGLDDINKSINAQTSAIMAASNDDDERIEANEQIEYQLGTWSDPTLNGDLSDAVPDENFLSDIYQSFLTNNPVSGYLSTSGVTAVGDCSMSWTWRTHDISFTICNFADVLQLWGVVLMSLTGLISLLVVVKR